MVDLEGRILTMQVEFDSEISVEDALPSSSYPEVREAYSKMQVEMEKIGWVNKEGKPLVPDLQMVYQLEHTEEGKLFLVIHTYRTSKVKVVGVPSQKE